MHHQDHQRDIFQVDALDLWCMTLTIQLVQDITKVNTCVKFYDHVSNASAERALTDRQTDRHTHTRTALFL